MTKENFLTPVVDGDVNSVNIQSIAAQLKGKEAKWASYLQFSIHTFCQKRQSSSIENDVIVAGLIDLCYSDPCLKYLTEMDRMTACIAAVTVYYCQRKQADNAIKLCAVLRKKAEEIQAASESLSQVRRTLYLCSRQLLELVPECAVDDMDKVLDILEGAIIPLDLLKIEDKKIANSIISTIIYAFSKLKRFPNNLYRAVDRILKIATRLGSDNVHLMKDFFTSRIYYALNASEGNVNATEELAFILQLCGMGSYKSCWNTVTDYFTTAQVASVDRTDLVIAAMKKIVCSKKSEEKPRWCFILLQFFGSKHWGPPSAKVIEKLYFKFILFLHQESKEFIGYTLEINSGQTRRLDTSFANAFKVIAISCRNLFKIKTDEWFKLIDVAADALSKCWEILEAGMIDNYVWNNSVCTACNCVEDVFSICHSVGGQWNYLRTLCLKCIPYLATTKRTLPVGNDRIDLIFNRWQYAATKLNDWKEAMLARGFQILACPWAREVAMTEWCRTKLIDGNTYKSLDFIEFVKKEESAFKLWLPTFEFSSLDKKSLLLTELRAYRAVASFNLELEGLSCWTILKSYKLSVTEFAFGLSCVIFFHIWTATKSTVDSYVKDCRKALKSLGGLQNNDREQAARICCYRGIVKFCLILCRIRKRDIAGANDSEAMVIDQLKDEAEEKVKFGGEVDMNITCDMDPTNRALSLGDEKDIVSDMGEIAEMWGQLPQLWADAALPSMEYEFMLEFVCLLANMAALYDASVISTRVWVIFYQISVRSENKFGQLRALAELIGYAELPSNSGISVIAKELSNSICTGTKLNQDGLETSLLYQLNFAEASLTEGNYSATVEALMSCKPLLETLRREQMYFKLKGMYLIVLSKLAIASPDHAAPFEVVSIQYLAFLGFSYMKSALGKCKKGLLGTAELCSQLLYSLSSSLWCVDVFSTLQLTRYVRNLVEDLYKIFQDLGITSRTVQLLAILAEVDLINAKLPEAKTKLNHLQSLLGLSPFELQKEDLYLNVPSIRTRELSPVRFSKGPLNHLDRSPLAAMILKTESSSASFQHPTSCVCHLCQSYVIKLALVELRLMEAIAESMDGRFCSAAKKYSDCRSLMAKLHPHHMQQAVEEVLMCIHSDTRVQLHFRAFSVFCTKFNMKYATFCMLPEGTKCMLKARELLNKADEILCGLTYDRTLLEWSYLELEMCYLSIEHHDKKSSEVKTVATRVTAGPVPRTPCPVRMKEIGVPTTRKRKQVIKKQLSLPSESQTTAAKTPHPLKSREDNKVIDAPKRKVISIPLNQGSPPKLIKRIGRRVFAEENKKVPVAKPTAVKRVEMTPAIRRQPPRSAAKSVRLVESKTVQKPWRRIRPVGTEGSSDDDIIQDSPEILTTVKAKKSSKTAAIVTRKLQFDDGEPSTSSKPTESNDAIEFDASKDLFDSFEHRRS